MIEVLSPGPLSSLQDLGRHGFQRYGVGPAGAMDEWSHRLANLLVGNALDAATLEITLLGPTLRFHQPALIAITGADFTPRLDEQPVALGWPLRVAAGSQLAFGRRRCGARARCARGTPRTAARRWARARPPTDLGFAAEFTGHEQVEQACIAHQIGSFVSQVSQCLTLVCLSLQQRKDLTNVLHS